MADPSSTSPASPAGSPPSTSPGPATIGCVQAVLLALIPTVVAPIVTYWITTLGKEHDGTPIPPIPKIQREIDKAFYENADAAEKLKRPFFILSANEHVQVEKELKDNKPVLHSSYRITYTIFALENIKEDEQVFNETFYHGDTNDKFVHWYGPAKENVSKGDEDDYYILLKMKKGEFRTFVTGADYYDSLPLQTGRTSDFDSSTLNGNEDEITYYNPGEVIANLEIVAESKSLQLKDVSARVRTAGGMKDLSTYNGNDTTKSRSFSMKQENVMPDQKYGLRFTF